MVVAEERDLRMLLLDVGEFGRSYIADTQLKQTVYFIIWETRVLRKKILFTQDSLRNHGVSLLNFRSAIRWQKRLELANRLLGHLLSRHSIVYRPRP